MQHSVRQGEQGFPRDQLSAKELLGVQYLRGVAVVLVVIHHLYTDEIRYLFIPQLGDFGVDIFFVISGFIMWHTTAQTRISVIEFWRHRIVRIVPLYWIFLSIVVAVALLAPQDLKSTVITPENAVKSFFFIPHFHVVQKIIAPILIPGWSLNYEMYFYFLFGVALLVPSRPLRATLLTVLLLGLVMLGFVVQPKGPIAVTYTNPELLKFLDGIILAILYRSNRLNGTILGSALLLIGILSHSISVSGNYNLFENFVGLSSTAVVAGVLALEPVLRRSPSILLHTVGNASYSIYLSHLFFVRLLELGWQHFLSLGWSELLDGTYVVLVFAFAMTGGIMVYYGIERPTLSLLRRWSSVKKAVQAGTG
jgi:exopolysaccharide production protein ExoZ